jgi:hypothetical protein
MVYSIAWIIFSAKAAISIELALVSLKLSSGTEWCPDFGDISEATLEFEL